MPEQYRINWKAIQANYDAIAALDVEPKCVKLSERSIAMILSQLGYLYWQKRWEHNGDWTEEQLANIRDWTANVEHQLLDSDNCEQDIPDESQCYNYTPSAPFVSYAPQDPFQQPDLTPAGYELPPFYHNAAIPLPGVQPGDAMVNLLGLPLFANIAEILESGFPRIRINLSGEGKVTMELVKVPQGGILLVNVDGALSGSTIYPLEFADLLDSAVFEDVFNVVVDGVTDNTFLIEQQISGAGTHFIDLTFLPVVSESEILGFGGGLRRIELCGFDQTGVSDVPQFRINDCTLQWRPNDTASWEDLADVCGAKGDKGDKGDTGEQGEQGIPGADGLPGAPGECPDDCTNVTGDERCNVAFGVVDDWIQNHVIPMINQMISDVGTLDVLNPDTFNNSVDAYTLVPDTYNQLRDTLIAIANDFTVDAPYHTFAEYLDAFTANLNTYEIGIQCLLFAAMPTGAYLTQTVISNFLSDVEVYGSGSSIVWFRLAEIGHRTALTSWAAMVNEARAIGGGWDCSTCGETPTDNWQYKWDYLTSDSSWVIDPDQNGATPAYTSGAGYYGVYNGGNGCGNIYEVGIMSPTFNLPSGSKITNVAITLDNTGGCGHIECYIGATRPTNLHNYNYAGSWGTEVDEDFEIDGSHSGLHAGLDWQNNSGSGHVTGVIISGQGVRPNFTGGSFI